MTHDDIATQAATDFHTRFGRPADGVWSAPGRVNLIGEHTDYNEGFVMPFAIDRQTVVAGRIRGDKLIRASALDLGETAEIDLSAASVKKRRTWIDYVEGTARCIEDRFG